MRVTRRGQKLAKSIMRDTVRGVIDKSQWNEELRRTVTTQETIYVGPARLRFTAVSGRTVDDAAALVTVQNGTMSLPIEGTGDIPVGARFQITASETNAGNVGRWFRVTAVHPQTLATARRFQVEHYEQKRT